MAKRGRKAKRKIAQKINREIEKRGTKGSFRKWCRRHGFSGGTAACARYALKLYRRGKTSRSIMKKARTALAFASMRKGRKRK